MNYTYTVDLPSTDPEVNKRMGYALPTSILLAPYLATNPYFVEFTHMVDEVFDGSVTSSLDAYGNIRNMWVTNNALEEKIVRESMIDFSDWSVPDRSLLVKQVNMLGMKLSNSGVADSKAYVAISRFVGQYWFEKGRKAAIDFLNFCLRQDFRMVKLWTNDYVTFVEDGSPQIGKTVWEGGTWYPTTHVAIIVEGSLNMSPQVLTVFFNDIANYNLVLHSIDQLFKSYITTTEMNTKCGIVALAVVCDNALVVSNKDSYGADPPPMNEFDWITTQFYSTVGPQVNYFLGKPSGWIKTHEGLKMPVYGKAYQQASYAYSLPTKCYGDGRYLCGDNLVWVRVPGSPKSPARIPAYKSRFFPADVEDAVYDHLFYEVSDIPIVNAGSMVDTFATIDDSVYDFIGVMSFVDGVHPRTYFGVSPVPITSPKGFIELYPFIYVPYW